MTQLAVHVSFNDKTGADECLSKCQSWVRAFDEKGAYERYSYGGKNAWGKLSTNKILTMDMILKRTEAASDKSDEAGLV